MVDYLAAKIGIGEAAHSDPVGLRARSPFQKTPVANSVSPQRIATKVGEPETPSSAQVGFGISKLLNVLAARKIDDAVGSCPASLGLDLGRLFDGSSGSIRGCNKVKPIGRCVPAHSLAQKRADRTGP